MVVTEVVQAANDEHPSHQGFGLLSQMTSATGQPGQALPESGIEPFDVGGVDHAAMLAKEQ
jgi:hypothetical protein